MAIPGFEKIKRISVVSQVHNRLKQGILDGSLLPGTHLAEPQIAAQMGVSRSPVREAFRLLEAEGLLEIRTSQGAFVCGLSTDQVREIYTARSLIEGYATELAAQNAMPADVERLRRAQAASIEAARREDYAATIEADFAFHRLIWEIAEHGILYDVLARLEVKIRMFMAAQAPAFDHLYDSVETHHQVIEAIAAGNAEAAKVGIQKHIDEAGMLAMRRSKKMQAEEGQA